jgi:nitrite reductase/ring-hydroxylating ferredoxin subunit
MYLEHGTRMPLARIADRDTTPAKAPLACGDDCGQDTDRRTFLRDGLMAVAALTAIAGSAPPLHALARGYATGLVGSGTVRYDIPAADGATIDRANRLILVRYQGMVHAFSLECPHKGTMVQWQPDQQRFYCPKHKSTFKPEGTRIQGKSPRSLDRYPVRLDAGKLVVDTAVEIDATKDAAGWSAAGVKVA